MHNDQTGWQRVQYGKARKTVSWRGENAVDVARNSRRLSKEPQNVVSFFFSNFPESYRAADMYRVFVDHGSIEEVVIPARRDGRRKRFGFMRFHDVLDPERMAIRLDNLFVEGIKLHVNLPRYSRDHGIEPRVKESMAKQDTSRTKKVWVEKVVNNTNNQTHQGGGVYKDALLRGGGNKHDISFAVGDDIMNQYSKAMVGEVHWPGKSYSIQDEFVRQGVFSIKATAMGANLVLLEGLEEEEDFKGFVEEHVA